MSETPVETDETFETTLGETLETDETLGISGEGWETCFECNGLGYWQDVDYIECDDCDGGMKQVQSTFVCSWCMGEGGWEI